MKRLAICLATVLLLTGCAGGKVDERSPLAQRVVELGKEGQAAYFKGDLLRAQRLFELALRDARQVEDSEGVAAMSVNLARVLRELGDSVNALVQLERVSAWHRSAIPARLAVEIELLSAVLLADGGSVDESLARLAVLREKCTADCHLSIGIENLQARLMLEKGDAAHALDLATTALTRFSAHGNPQERANLWRVKGEASLALGDHATARQALETALAIDKTLALPAKIALDLEALANAALAAKDGVAHAHYLARLADVRRARQNSSAK